MDPNQRFQLFIKWVFNFSRLLFVFFLLCWIIVIRIWKILSSLFFCSFAEPYAKYLVLDEAFVWKADVAMTMSVVLWEAVLWSLSMTERMIGKYTLQYDGKETRNEKSRVFNFTLTKWKWEMRDVFWKHLYKKSNYLLSLLSSSLIKKKSFVISSFICR